MKIIDEYIKEVKSDYKNKKLYRHIPNLLTFIRLISPLIIIPLFLLNKYYLAFTFVIISACTDIFDGLIARKFNLVSEFGRLLDATCDKVFSLSLLIPVIKINIIYVVLILLEVSIGITNYFALKSDKKPRTHYVGKVKTVIEFIFIGLCYLSFVKNIDVLFLNIVFVITIIFDLISLSMYLVKNSK